MPRRNLLILLVVALVALVCYQRVEKNPYARVLADAMSTIERRALEPVKDSQLFERAMDGMLDSLDQNSAYLTPDDLEKFEESIDLQFAGVGMELGLDPETKQLTVLSPLVGSPAHRAGILAGDRILRVGKTATEGMSLNEAIMLLHGKPGEPVTLSILHPGEEKPKEVRLVREIVQVASVLGDTRNADGSWNFFLAGRDRIGYIRISSFTDETVVELRDALAWLTAHDMRGLVLDLRDDPGGYLDAAVDVCDLFLRSGAIVTTKRRSGQTSRVCTASGNAPFVDFPLALVVNQQTASAAEIVAACLQDNHRAVVVGQRSFGKGTVQEIVHLGQEYGAMKLTTASYWRPSGRNIQRPPRATAKDQWGVSPNEGFQVVLDKDEFEHWQLWRAERDVFRSPTKPAPTKKGEKPFVDRQLLRAVEYLEKKVE
jgi:carboxyl-terminal processing protease